MAFHPIQCQANSLRIHSLAEIPISPPQRNLSCSPRFCAVEAFEINISPPPLSALRPHLRIAFTIVKSFPRTLRAPFMLRRNISAGKYFSFISFESVAWDTSLLLTGASSWLENILLSVAARLAIFDYRKLFLRW